MSKKKAHEERMELEQKMAIAESAKDLAALITDFTSYTDATYFAKRKGIRYGDILDEMSGKWGYGINLCSEGSEARRLGYCVSFEDCLKIRKGKFASGPKWMFAEEDLYISWVTRGNLNKKKGIDRGVLQKEYPDLFFSEYEDMKKQLEIEKQKENDNE